MILNYRIPRVRNHLINDLSNSGFLKNISSSVYGDVPIEVGGNNTTGFGSYFSKANSGTFLSMFGGQCNNSLGVGRFWDVSSLSTYSYWTIGGSPIYLNPIKNAITNNQIDTIWNS